MNAFSVGDEIVDENERKGTIIDSFPFRDSSDGYAYPNVSQMSGWLPIEWSDGTQGYRPIDVIFYFFL